LKNFVLCGIKTQTRWVLFLVGGYLVLSLRFYDPRRVVFRADNSAKRLAGAAAIANGFAGYHPVTRKIV
jgi:hypothetical protein